MNTSHSPYFLPPTRFSKPFFCNFAIMNFTPSSVILPSAFAASTLVALGLSLKYSNTFFWVVSKFFWVAISFFWVVSISSNCPFWVADSLFWVAEEVSIFCATLPLFDFMGGVGYSIAIPTAIRVIAIADIDRYGLCRLTPINNL